MSILSRCSPHFPPLHFSSQQFAKSLWLSQVQVQACHSSGKSQGHFEEKSGKLNWFNTTDLEKFGFRHYDQCLLETTNQIIYQWPFRIFSIKHPPPPSRWLFQTWLQGSGICTLTSWLVWQNIKYWLLKYLIVCFYFYSAVTLHSVSFTKEWQQEDSHYNYKIISFLQSCSEYEFKVQVILQGRSPGPFSATVKAKTQTARK